jgi:CRP/FNR family transcriptional regulator, cyclic AMP receptor protein
MDNSFWFLEEGELSSLICPNKLDDYKAAHNVLTYKKGEYIFYSEKKTDNIFYMLKGRVLLGTYTDTNIEVPTTIIQKGDIFGQISVISGHTRDDYALVSDTVQLCAMSLEQLKKLLKDDSLVNILVMKMMGSRVHEMEQRLHSLMFKDSKTRIIEFIIRCIEKNGQRMGYEWIVRSFSTHKEVANLTATSRQTVTMIMNELRNENIIHFDRKRLLIRDLERLKSLVNVAVS